jgi:hypothetical protein
MATMRPGVGAAKAIFRGRAAVLLKTVMKSDSPASMRLPALSTAPPTPACAPSPTAVVIVIPSSMYITLPASATAATPVASSSSTNCISAP